VPEQARLWKVTETQQLREVPQGRLDVEDRLESWLEQDISLLGEDLLVIGKQVATDFGGYIDLLCIDPEGDLVVVELKRDKTPREVTAQVLDYASWVADLSNEDVREIADGFLGQGELEGRFRGLFDEDLPDVVNANHRMLVVAAHFDASSERIIQYLSDRHGVRINAVTFQYFQLPSGEELLTGVFLIEPEQVEYRAKARGRSKRKPNLTHEELEGIAMEMGVGELYQDLFGFFASVFPRHRPTRSTIGFKGDWGDGRGVILNLLPGESGQVQGVRFQVFAQRLAQFFGGLEDDIKALLPNSPEPWEFGTAREDWKGFAGWFRSVDEAKRLIEGVRDRRRGTNVV